MTEPGSIKKAIPLISYSSSTRIFDINQEAIEFLKTLSGPIGVVSVAGRYRTGKSYLLNRVFLNRQSGFSVGPTVNPCTKGLWIWPSPVEGFTKDGRRCSIIIIDSEGIGALDEDTDHDTRIFSLAILLSSCFVYNSVGAIDENALSCLSLVVNITKHVHINSSQSGVHSYSEYFPDFMWIVRDFTLRLVDSLGNPITPKEYLENALKPQKTSENDEKNKIRRHLSEYFKERDCTTLVRPIESEKSLQNLDFMELESLRTEFVEQVSKLREKVLYKINAKSLNGKELTGEMFANLINSYVESMNSGVVPNIESSWTIVCKLQNKKIMDEAKEMYEKKLFSEKLPQVEENLKKVHKIAKKTALDYFLNTSIVEEPKLRNELEEFIKKRFELFKTENSNISKKESGGLLKELYEKLENKIKKSEIKTLQQFDKEMKTLEKEFFNTFKGPSKLESFIEFYKEKYYYVSEYFLHSATNELALHKDLSSEHISRIEKELKTVSDQLICEKNTAQLSSSLLQSEKSEFSAKEKSLKDQISSLMMDREKLEKTLKETLEGLKHKNQIELEKISLKNSELQETIKELERDLLRKKSDIDEERALTGQKVKLLENSLEELKQKDKQNNEKIKEIKGENLLTAKQISSKYENLILKLQEKLDNKGHDFKDLESEIENKDNTIEELKQSLADTQIALAAEKSENSSMIEVLSRKLKQKEDEVLTKLNFIEQDKTNEIVRLKSKIEDYERKLKHSEEELRNTNEKSNQELAILSQKLEFFEQEIEEHKARRIEEKRQYESRISSLEQLAAPKPETNIQKIRAEFSEEVSRIIKDHESEKIGLNSKIEDLIDLKNDIELKLKLERNDWTHKEKGLKDSLNEALAAKSKLLLDLAAKSFVTKDPKYKKKISELEQEIENLSTRSLEELESIKAKNELTIAQLRTFFDQEKSRFEQRIGEEKSKNEKRVNETIEEYEEKISSIQAANNEEIRNLQEEFNGMENYYSSEIKTLNESLEFCYGRINDLDSYILSLREQINEINSANAFSSKSQISAFNDQKIELLRKIDSLTDEISLKDKNLITNKYEIEKAYTLLSSKTKEFEDLLSKYNKEKSDLSEKLFSLNEKYESLYNDHIKTSNKSKRDLALANNEIELLHKRCKDLEDSICDIERKNKENIESIKEDSSMFANLTVKRLEKEKENLEKKLDEKKKNFKALETLSAKQLAGLERERAVLEEKLSHSDRKRTEIEQYYLEMVSNLQGQLSNRPNFVSNLTNSESEALKLQISKLERDLAARQISYDRDKSLWENKFNFLVQQRDYSRKELTSAQEKFDQIIEELKKKHAIDREKQEQSANTLIANLENRYNGQMNDMQTRYEQTIKEIRDKNRAFEKNSQNLLEEIDNERRERLNLAASFEKKLQQSLDSEKKVSFDLQTEKNNKEALLNSMLEKFSKERDEWKGKISDFEKKIKDLDSQKSGIFLQSEKERVKWTLEKEELLAKYSETQQQLNFLLKKQEDLRKENEKLKTPRPRSNRKGDAGLSFDDFKYSKTQSGRSTPTNSTVDSPRVKGFVIQRTLSRENIKDS